jgi:hypothetical protein
MRTTKKDVQGMFTRLLKAYGKRQAPIMVNDNADDVMHIPGGWILDYNSVYGGYVIEQEEGRGCISHPFGAGRRNAREMYLSMHMACCVLEQLALEKQEVKRLKW